MTFAGPQPKPRMGHAAAVLGQTMLIQGGRESPESPLNDLWALDLNPRGNKKTAQRLRGTRAEGGGAASAGRALSWRPVEAKGMPPEPRHRHTAVAVGGSLKVQIPQQPTYVRQKVQQMFYIWTVGGLWKIEYHLQVALLRRACGWHDKSMKRGC